MKIVLVDDHLMLCAGLRRLIQTQSDMEVVAEAHDAASALSAVKQFRPDLVLMDIVLPGEDGFAISRKVIAQFPETKILFLSGVRDRACIDMAIQIGASGFVLKESEERELIAAIRSVMEGHFYLSPAAARPLVDSYKNLLERRMTYTQALFSKRETEILGLFADGLRIKEIADRLGVSSKTVETYRARLLSKSKCTSTVELVRYAIREGLVEA